MPPTCAPARLGYHHAVTLRPTCTTHALQAVARAHETLGEIRASGSLLVELAAVYASMGEAQAYLEQAAARRRGEP